MRLKLDGRLQVIYSLCEITILLFNQREVIIRLSQVGCKPRRRLEFWLCLGDFPQIEQHPATVKMSCRRNSVKLWCKGSFPQRGLKNCTCGQPHWLNLVRCRRLRCQRDDLT